MIRRALSNIIIVALAVAWGCSAWQAHLLRAQVRALQSENRIARAQKGNMERGQNADAQDQSWVSRADAHLARAGDALSRADVGRAQREMTAGAEDMQRAVRDPITRTQTTFAQAHAQMTRLDNRLKTLQAQIGDVSAKTSPRIRLLRAQAVKLQSQARALWPAEQP